MHFYYFFQMKDWGIWQFKLHRKCRKKKNWWCIWFGRRKILICSRIRPQRARPWWWVTQLLKHSRDPQAVPCQYLFFKALDDNKDLKKSWGLGGFGTLLTLLKCLEIYRKTTSNVILSTRENTDKVVIKLFYYFTNNWWNGICVPLVTSVPSTWK